MAWSLLVASPSSRGNQRPQWANRIFLGNALTWQPPMRFDFVRVELVYVPVQRQRDLLQRLLREVVAPGGRLIVCGYGSPRSGQSPHAVRRLVRLHGFEPEVELVREAPRAVERSSEPRSCERPEPGSFVWLIGLKGPRGFSVWMIFAAACGGPSAKC